MTADFMDVSPGRFLNHEGTLPVPVRSAVLSAVKFSLATPPPRWERGTNENTNGLIRQHLPKGRTMKGVTQTLGDMIAEQLNNRPRKRHGYKTPHQCFLRH